MERLADRVGPLGELRLLPRPSIDTGMGLERTVAVLAGHGDVYFTDDDPTLYRSRDLVMAGPSVAPWLHQPGHRCGTPRSAR